MLAVVEAQMSCALRETLRSCMWEAWIYLVLFPCKLITSIFTAKQLSDEHIEGKYQ